MVERSEHDKRRNEQKKLDSSETDSFDDVEDANARAQEIPASLSSPWEVVALFFMCGIGTSLSVSAVMSALVYYGAVFGSNFFVYVNAAIYIPLVPISLLQARWDTEYDLYYGTKGAFAFRGTFSFVTTIVVVSCLPLASSSLMLLCALSALLGLSSSIVMGTMNQFASFVSTCGRNQAGFLFGYQTAGIIVLVLSFTTGFGQSSNSNGEMPFYGIVAGITGLSLVSFLILIFVTREAQKAIVRRDSQLLLSQHSDINSAREISIVATPLLVEDSTVDNETLNEDNETSIVTNEEVTLLTFPQLFQRTKICALCIFASVSTNIAMTAWFAKVESSMMMLPKYLFFIRIFADTFGRPASLVASEWSISTISFVTTMRLCLIPLFFLTASASWFPLHGNPFILMALVAIIAFLSGFITTSCYQIAPKLLSNAESPSVAKQASLLNIAFSISACAGVLFSLVLQLSGF